MVEVAEHGVVKAIVGILREQGRLDAWFYLHPQISITRSYWQQIKAGKKPVPEWLPSQAALVLGVPVAILTAPLAPNSDGSRGRDDNSEGPAPSPTAADPSETPPREEYTA